jgi:hypothetical protein
MAFPVLLERVEHILNVVMVMVHKPLAMPLHISPQTALRH